MDLEATLDVAAKLGDCNYSAIKSYIYFLYGKSVIEILA